MMNSKYYDIGTDLGYFRFGLTNMSLIVTVFFVPETGKVSLGSIDEYFVSGAPTWKTSLKKYKQIMASRHVAESKLEG